MTPTPTPKGEPYQALVPSATEATITLHVHGDGMNALVKAPADIRYLDLVNVVNRAKRAFRVRRRKKWEQAKKRR